MFEEHAGVLDNKEAGGVSFGCGGFVGDSLLEPEGFGVNGDGGIGHARDVFGAAKDVNDVNGERNVFESRVRFLAEHFGFVGIDGDDFVAGGLEVGGDAVRWTEAAGGKADDGDGFGAAEEIADRVGGCGRVCGEMEEHVRWMNVTGQE